MDLIRFAILGLGAGAIYALMAQGVVVVYRGSGVVNFAHGAYGMIGAFYFYLWRDGGMATPLALVGALALGAGMGAATHLLVMRPLRNAPGLSRLIATLGILVLLLAFGLGRWGDTPRILPRLLPTDPVEVLPDVIVGRDRLILAGIAVVLTVVLMAAYRWTRFGLATTAVAESQRSTAMLGVSPDLVATVNWAIGSCLAVAAGILIVNVTGLNVANLTLLIIPGLAAALVGGFRSFPLTLAGGFLIGILEAEVIYLQTKVSDPTFFEGWGRSIPFLVIIVVLMIRGRPLPLRSETVERPPEVGTGRIRPPLALGGLVIAAFLVAFVMSDNLVEATTTSATVAIVALSLVVVTGYAGQVSLAQFALAGTGAWIAARLVVNYDFGFEIAAVIGILGAIPIGLLVGLPALRTRGVNLAVVTLGLALVLESVILNNGSRTGGITGTQIGSPSFFGIDVDTTRHPERYALLALAVLAVVAVLVANVRRGRTGRRLVAVRTNERAAAALGISVVGAKLYAFGLAAAIAATGGVLIGFRRPSVVFYPTFSVFKSILVVVYAVIGGIGFVVGAMLGAALAPSGLAAGLAGDVLDNEELVQFLLGATVVVVLLLIPNGLASIDPRRLPLVRGWLSRPQVSESLADPGRPDIVSRSLSARDLSVRFGGVVALEGVSIEIRPGEVVGLIGPNGAGKTTLIDAVTGFVDSSGTVHLDDEDISGLNPRRRANAGIGRSFQSLELFESMTLRENLVTAGDRRDMRAYVSDLLWPGRAELSPAAVAVIRDFGLEVDLDRRPDELAYGRRRLVALARAVAAAPSILLLDEPAAGLGADDTEELGRLVRRLADEWGIGVLLVEHDVSLVLEVCDQVTVIDFGTTIAAGTPSAIRQDPRVIEAYLGRGGSSSAPLAPLATPSPSPAPTRDTAPLLEARDLSAGYGGVAAVRELDLEVGEGEVLALLGANGAGKTTTLLALAGELRPLDGEVRWKGSVTEQPLHRRAAQMSLVPEERSVIRGLSVQENLRLARVDVADAVELFPELEGLLGRPAGLISGGEQQMLTLARAMGRQPQLLLADELSLGLAPLIVDRLLRMLRTAADRGVGVVVVEQHARRVLDVADRIAVLRRGSVVLSCTAAEARERFDLVERAYLGDVD